jgi:hypothetical protein
VQHDAAEREELTGDKEVPGSDAFSYDQVSHRSFGRPHVRTLNESTNVGVKTGGPQGRGPELWIRDRWGTRDDEHGVYPGLGPLEEVIPYVLLDCIGRIVWLQSRSTSRSA